MFNKAAIFTLMLITTVLSGCTTYQQPVKDVDLVEVSYDAVDTLLKQLSQPIPKGSLIIVSTLVNVDDLNQTSAFGRIVSDQLASAFNNSGYRIRGMEMQTALFVKEESGILHLSDETKETLGKYNASALVAGVFAAGRRTAYVSLRIVDLNSKNIISSTDYSVPMGPDARVLLKPKKTGDAKPELDINGLNP